MGVAGFENEHRLPGLSFELRVETCLYHLEDIYVLVSGVPSGYLGVSQWGE